MLKKIIIILLICTVSIILSGCKNVFKVDTPSIEKKVNEEIEYLDSEIIAMLNSLNNIIYTNYKVIPVDVKQSNTASNPNKQMNESGTANSSDQSEQKETLQTSGQSTSSTEQKTSGSSEQEPTTKENNQGLNNQENNKFVLDKTNISSTNTMKMQPATILNIEDINIDWVRTKSDIEILNTAWITSKMDLQQIGVPNNLLDDFSKQLNNTTIAIKNNDKVKTVDGLTKMYTSLYEITNSYCTDKFKIVTIQTKKYVLEAYNYIESSNWEQVSIQINNAEQEFEQIKNYENVEQNKRIDIARISILIDEMKDSIELKDRELILLKYKDLIQELSIL